MAGPSQNWKQGDEDEGEWCVCFSPPSPVCKQVSQQSTSEKSRNYFFTKLEKSTTKTDGCAVCVLNREERMLFSRKMCSMWKKPHKNSFQSPGLNEDSLLSAEEDNITLTLLNNMRF